MVIPDFGGPDALPGLLINQLWILAYKGVSFQ
jgi:hypothetical protein